MKIIQNLEYDRINQWMNTYNNVGTDVSNTPGIGSMSILLQYNFLMSSFTSWRISKLFISNYVKTALMHFHLIYFCSKCQYVAISYFFSRWTTVSTLNHGLNETYTCQKTAYFWLPRLISHCLPQFLLYFGKT